MPPPHIEKGVPPAPRRSDYPPACPAAPREHPALPFQYMGGGGHGGGIHIYLWEGGHGGEAFFTNGDVFLMNGELFLMCGLSFFDGRIIASSWADLSLFHWRVNRYFMSGFIVFSWAELSLLHVQMFSGGARDCGRVERPGGRAGLRAGLKKRRKHIKHLSFFAKNVFHRKLPFFGEI